MAPVPVWQLTLGETRAMKLESLRHRKTTQRQTMWGVFSRKRWKRGPGLLSGPPAPGVWESWATLGSGSTAGDGGLDPKVEKHKGVGGAGLREGVQLEEGASSVKG